MYINYSTGLYNSGLGGGCGANSEAASNKGGGGYMEELRGLEKSQTYSGV